MSAEHVMRRRVLSLLSALDAVPVENAVVPGTPDVNCTAGWIELKYLPQLPARSSSPVRVPHFTSVQRAWLRRRASRCGKVWVLLHVHSMDAWLLLRGAWAALHLGEVTWEQLKCGDGARLWEGAPSAASLIQELVAA